MSEFIVTVEFAVKGAENSEEAESDVEQALDRMPTFNGRIGGYMVIDTKGPVKA